MISPPAHLEPYVMILGEDLAVEFFLTFGGAELVLFHTPRRARLVDVIGHEKAAALAANSDRFQMPKRVPTGKVWIAQVLRQKGWTVADIARRLHTSDVTVRKYIAYRGDDAPADRCQMRLF